MKPLQVGLLMAAAAVSGGLFMRWENHGTQPASVPAVATAPPAPAPIAAAVPTAPEPVAAAPVAPVKASPFSEPRSADSKPADSKPRLHARPEPAKSAVHAVEKQETASVQPPAAVPPAPNAPVKSEPVSVRAEPVSAPAPPPPPPPPPARVTVTAGTLIAVRTIESLSSDRNSSGDAFSATLTQPLVVDGFVIAERGARAEGRIIESQRAGRVKGVSDLALQLTRIHTADGQSIAIETESFTKHGEQSLGRDAAKVGGGAALGAIIGAIAGGGKGAGIGAGIGGAAGAGDVALTRGKPVNLPSETQLNFRLRAPVTVTERR